MPEAPSYVLRASLQARDLLCSVLSARRRKFTDILLEIGILVMDASLVESLMESHCSDETDGMGRGLRRRAKTYQITSMHRVQESLKF